MAPLIIFFLAFCSTSVFDAQVNIRKSTFVQLNLISQGRLQLSYLGDIINVAAENKEKRTIIWMLLQAFYQARLISHQNTGRYTCVVIFTP